MHRIGWRYRDCPRNGLRWRDRTAPRDGVDFLLRLLSEAPGESERDTLLSQASARFRGLVSGDSASLGYRLKIVLLLDVEGQGRSRRAVLPCLRMTRPEPWWGWLNVSAKLPRSEHRLAGDQIPVFTTGSS